MEKHRRVGFSKMSKYHDGEKQVQNLAGARLDADRLSGMVRHSIPDVAQHFLDEQEFAGITWRDKSGRLWITPVTGAPGFLLAVNNETIVCDLSRAIAPVLNEQVFQDSPVALVVMDFENRRRMRINGFATSVAASGTKTDFAGSAASSAAGSDQPPSRSLLVIKTAEVYGNCPKYIQRRAPIDDSVSVGVSSDAVVTLSAIYSTNLNLSQQRLVNSADTFFIGTFAAGNADASHRGGNPGFVRTDGERIYWLDFPGNNMFNTLGNVQSNREAALFFPDFETGDGLAVSGQI
jgi:predicted pyridoxine 5'-phosphate oxidase superfamily flavin-nucleotide-binding protein